MSHYELVAKIIRFLDERHAEQPDLKTLAGRVGLSQFHFHRLFSAWAGITPKDFLQCLTLAHAKDLLRDDKSILDVTVESGLSGPSRLHDLFVNLEAASPGELKSGGAGWTISFGFAESPFGECLIAESPRGICHLSFVANKKASIAELQRHWSQAKIKRNDLHASHLVKNVFMRPTSATPKAALRAFVCGTPFQVRVWKALLQIQPGMLTSYGRVASAIDKPTAARAVGTAVGQNPLAFLIPCHRVIRQTGAIGEYQWGQIRKRAMVAWESSHAQDNSCSKIM